MSKNIMFPFKKRMARKYEEQEKSHEPFRGVVALVDVCSGYRELVLKAVLEELGATVTPKRDTTATHLIWSQKGCCDPLTHSQLLPCIMVSPLYVDVCTKEKLMLMEPSTSRKPDLPSATTLLKHLKAAEQLDQWPSVKGSENSSQEKQSSSLMSSDFDNNTTTTISKGKLQDVTQDAEECNDEQNTSLHVTNEKPRFTADRKYKEAQLRKVSLRYKVKKKTLNKRIANWFRSMPVHQKRILPTQTQHARPSNVPRIVLTGMPKSQKQAVLVAIKALKGKVQKNVDKYTTHVLLGLCKEDVNTTCCSVSNVDRAVINNDNEHMSGRLSGIVNEKQMRTVKTLLGAVRGCRVLHAQWALDSQKAKKWLPHSIYEVEHLQNIAQSARVERISLGKMRENYKYNVFQGKWVYISKTAEMRDAAIQLLTECGGHIINCFTNTQDFFEKNTQCNQRPHGGITQNGGAKKRNVGKAVGNCDIIRIGSDPDEISSVWVFDSVVAGNPRTTHRYVNKKFDSEISISN